MKAKTVRTVFIAVLIYLPLQYGIVGIVGYYHSEPWPAFVFPGFKSVHDNGFEIQQPYFEVFAEGAEEPERVLPQDFFPELPLSQVPGFLRTHFQSAEDVQQLSSGAKNWLKHHAVEVAGVDASKLDVVIEMNYFSHEQDILRLDSTVVKERFTIELNGRP
jgi:hypothetical protein